MRARALFYIAIASGLGCSGGPSLPGDDGARGDPVSGDTDSPGDAAGGDALESDAASGDPLDGDALGGDAAASGDADLAGVWITARLDGQPTEGIDLVQGGTDRAWRTGPDGRALVQLDATVVGDHAIVASHAEARTRAMIVADGVTTLTIDLERFSTLDNAAYVFADPGVPGQPTDTRHCGHCHLSIAEAWYASPHRRSATNRTVQDLFAGTASGFGSATLCANAGGTWRVGRVPGSDATAARCYLGDGALPALNPGCMPGLDCESNATAFGACADCHAPGINGALGGRSLLEARGLEHETGVSCDVCHKVESIALEAPPGVAGRLRIVRPLEPSPSPSFGPFRPLTFGPHRDVPNPRMGNAPRAHFKDATLCAGCHELRQGALVPGTALDPTRWPEGLPVHSTYSEWLASPFSPAAPCQSCHMPPDPGPLNAADLQNVPSTAGLVGGWPRPPGAVRRHAWFGPRQPESRMLENAAALFVTKELVSGELRARVTVKNVGPGHALPTGEPLRALLLRVEATCGATPLRAVGGDAVPDLGGHLGQKLAGEDWGVWPPARVGDLVRVTQLPGDFHDYRGYGPFGDGSFSPAQKGLPVQNVVGEGRVVQILGGRAIFEPPLPAGDVAYLIPGDAGATGVAARAWAGAPGFAFARALVGNDGARQVPHFLAVDLASDNRLLPQQAWTSEHRFLAPCAEPRVRAVLEYRAYPWALARARRWPLREVIIAEVNR